MSVFSYSLFLLSFFLFVFLLFFCVDLFVFGCFGQSAMSPLTVSNYENRRKKTNNKCTVIGLRCDEKSGLTRIGEKAPKNLFVLNNSIAYRPGRCSQNGGNYWTNVCITNEWFIKKVTAVHITHYTCNRLTFFSFCFFFSTFLLFPNSIHIFKLAINYA